MTVVDAVSPAQPGAVPGAQRPAVGTAKLGAAVDAGLASPTRRRPRSPAPSPVGTAKIAAVVDAVSPAQRGAQLLAHQPEMQVIQCSFFQMTL